MQRIVIGSVILLSLPQAVHSGINSLIGVGLLLVIIFGALHYLFAGKLPHHFWRIVGGIIFGPCLLYVFLQALTQALNGIFATPAGGAVFTLMLLGLIVASFLYVRAKILHWLHRHGRNNTTNERQPVFPVRVDHED